jgi:tetratricopeptide (TPR) repeat protein
LRLDPADADALSARACVFAMHDWKWDEAEADFRRAVALRPQAVTAHQWYAMNLLVPLRRFDDARRQLELAREYDPLSPVVASSWALVHFFEGDYDRAIAEQEVLLARDADFGMAHFFIAQASIAARAPAKALEHLRVAAALVGGTPEIIATLGVAHAAAGNHAAAHDAAVALEKRARDSYASPVLLAQIQAAVGDLDSALASLERAREERATDLVWIGVRPTFDPLRLHPRFLALMSGIGLAPAAEQSGAASRGPKS